MIQKTNTALLIVDVQNDFLPGGALAVTNGNEIVSYINSIIGNYSSVIASLDWHPENHESFASNHKNAKVGDVIMLKGDAQVLWPPHCIENTKGAEFPSDLDIEKITHIIYKGKDPKIDSYSAFYDNNCKKYSHLNYVLQSLSINTLHVCGLATDYCVLYTVCDAVAVGYNVVLLSEGCRAVNLKEDDEEKAIARMKSMGVTIY